MGIVLTSAQNPFHNTGTIVSPDFGVYGINDPFTVANTGLIWGQGSYGVQLRDGRLVVNGSSAATHSTIRGGNIGVDIEAAHRATQYNGPATVTNFGTIAGGGYSGVLFSDAGGTVINGAAGVPGAQIYGGENGVTFRNGSSAYPSAVTNFGTIRGVFTGIGLQSGGTVVNRSAAGLSAYIGGGNVGVGVAFAGQATITNRGTIAGPGQFGISFIFGAGGSVTNGGVGATNALISGGQSGVLFQNTGVPAGVGTVTNSGTILGGGYGVYLANGGTVANQAVGSVQGLIRGTGVPSKYASNIQSRGILIQGAPGSVSNTGIIQGHYAGIELRAGGTISNGIFHGLAGRIAGDRYGVVVSGAPAMVINSGSIAGGYGAGVAVLAQGSLYNLGAGRITGAVGVSVLRAAGTLTNAGLIQASTDGVELYNAAESMNNTGSIVGGHSGILFFGMQSFDGTVTNDPSGVISGGSYGILCLVGSGGGLATIANSGTIAGGTGRGIELDAGGTVANAGTITGGNGIAIQLFASNNRVVVDPGAVFSGVVLGGAYTSTSNVLELASAASAGSIGGIGAQYRYFGSVIVDAGARWTFAGTNAVPTGSQLEIYGQLTNTGVLQGNAIIEGGGALTNRAGASIAGTVYGTYGPGSLTNFGAIASAGLGGAKLEAGGSVVNGAVAAPGASIGGANYGVYIGGGSGTVTNLGIITGAAVAGVLLAGGGSVINGTTTTPSASITGWSGVALYAGGSVTNLGTITGTGFAGIDLAQGGSVANTKAGSAAGMVGGSLFGVAVEAGTATILNAGTITGATGIGFYPGAIGGVSNSGTIAGTGGTAVDFGTGSGNLLKVFPGAAFQGNVVGSGTNTLELAKATGIGTIAGVGTAFAGFSQMQVDSAASWRMTGANAIAHIVNNGTLQLQNSTTLNVTVAVDAGDTGLYQLSTKSVLEIASIVGSNTQIKFLGAATIIADHAASFGINVGAPSYAGPVIEQFVAGDKMDLADLGVGGVTLNSAAATGLLQVANAASQQATLLFQDASLGAGTFHVADDGTGHALITHS